MHCRISASSAVYRHFRLSRRIKQAPICMYNCPGKVSVDIGHASPSVPISLQDISIEKRERAHQPDRARVKEAIDKFSYMSYGSAALKSAVCFSLLFISMLPIHFASTTTDFKLLLYHSSHSKCQLQIFHKNISAATSCTIPQYRVLA
jgi:hypothetical protein